MPSAFKPVVPTKKSRLRLGCWVLIKDRYNNDKTECPRGEIGRHKGLKSRGIHIGVSP